MAQPFVIHKFWTVYKSDPANPLAKIAIDMVEIGPVGQGDRTRTPWKVSDLKRVQPLEGSTNPAVLMANERWAVVEPRYNAWKAGQETPLEGIPLGAWPALSPEQADLFRSSGIKTVEDVSQLTDAHIVRFPIPNMRDLVRQAKLYIESADQAKFAANLNAKDQKIADLEAARTESDEMLKMVFEEMKELKAQLAAKPEADKPERKTKAA